MMRPWRLCTRSGSRTNGNGTHTVEVSSRTCRRRLFDSRGEFALFTDRRCCEHWLHWTVALLPSRFAAARITLRGPSPSGAGRDPPSRPALLCAVVQHHHAVAKFPWGERAYPTPITTTGCPMPYTAPSPTQKCQPSVRRPHKVHRAPGRRQLVEKMLVLTSSESAACDLSVLPPTCFAGQKQRRSPTCVAAAGS